MAQKRIPTRRYVKALTAFTVRQKDHASIGMPFPIDMLRYDHCFPRTTEDSDALGFAYREKLGSFIEVSLQGSHSPTKTRWESFGWTIVVRSGSTDPQLDFMQRGTGVTSPDEMDQ